MRRVSAVRVTKIAAVKSTLGTTITPSGIRNASGSKDPTRPGSTVGQAQARRIPTMPPSMATRLAPTAPSQRPARYPAGRMGVVKKRGKAPVWKSR